MFSEVVRCKLLVMLQKCEEHMLQSTNSYKLIFTPLFLLSLLFKTTERNIWVLR